MDPAKVALTAKRMTEARAVLIRDYPFLGHLSLGLQLACAPCGTACTDAERLIFDPDFAEQLRTDREMEFVVLHEVLHCALEHCTRGGTRDADIYNIACDIVVNSTILEMWGLDTIQVAGEEPVHLAPDGQEGSLYSAEEVYRMLLTRSNDRSGSNCGDAPATYGAVTPLDRHDIWKGIGNAAHIRDTWNRRIRNAVSACQGTAHMPQSLRKLAEQLLERSKVDWKQLLHDFIQHDIYDYSFLPPDRRYSDMDVFIPSYSPDDEQGTANDIWVCVDTSASISDSQLAEAMSEVQDAMRQAGLTGSVSFFDADITDPEPFATEEEFQRILPKGGGGTSFHVIFRYLREKLWPELPRAILIFTDGYVWSWPREEDALDVPVLWLICEGGNSRAPWGQVALL